MARPKYSDILARNVAQIRASRKWRQGEGYDDLWHSMVDLYRGKHYPKDAKKEDRMLVNLAFATKNVIAPSVAVNNPKFVVNARKQEGAATAIITEQVLNYLWRTHRYQEDFRLAVDDFLVCGHGWLKVGYKATKPIELKKVPDSYGDEGSGEDSEGVDDRDETVVGNVESEVRSFSDDDRPFIERLSPWDVFVDPDARHPKEMKWIAQRTRRPAADVKVDSRYDKTQRERACSSLMGKKDDSVHPSEHGTDYSDVSYVDVWEYYDIRRGTVATFIEEQMDGFLIAPAPMPYTFGHPFVMMRNYEVTDLFYPMGELEAIEELQQELNSTRSQMMNHRKRYQRKTLYDKDAFEQDGIDALKDDSDNVMVPVDLGSAQSDITKVLAPMPQMGTPPDFYNQSDLISSDIDRVSGVSDYMRGAQQNIRRTATEAAMIQDAQNSRAADKLARVEQVLAQLGQRLVQLMQQYMTGERVVRIVGMRSAPVWIQFDADYIQGEFDFEVEGGSTRPNNESGRRQSALDLVNALGPFVDAGVVNPQALARHILQFGFDIKDPDQFLMGAQPQGGAPGQPQPEGMPPEGGMPQGGPPMPPQMGPTDAPPEMGSSAESPIKGIPPELIAQLMGSSGLKPQGAM